MYFILAGYSNFQVQFHIQRIITDFVIQQIIRIVTIMLALPVYRHERFMRDHIRMAQQHQCPLIYQWKAVA